MRVVILAAGRGSRLGERTKDRPKCMVEVGGKTILERCMQTLHKAGVQRSEIGIVTGYRPEGIKVEGVHYFHNANWENTNMFCSLLEAKEWLEQEPCVVCYSDIIFSEKAVQALQQDSSELAITYYTGFWELWCARMADPLSDLETFKLDAKQNLTEIGKKPQSKADITGQYMGLIKFTPQSWQWVQEVIKEPLPKPVAKLDMTTLLQALVEHGHPVHAIATDELWLECDTQEDIEAYERQYSAYL